MSDESLIAAVAKSTSSGDSASRGLIAAIRAVIRHDLQERDVHDEVHPPPPPGMP